MFAKLSAVALFIPFVASLTLQVPQNVVSAGKTTISWTSDSGDSVFSLFLVNEIFHNSFAIANNVNPADGSITLNLPIVPAGDGYTLSAVNITNINDVYSQTSTFAIAPTPSTSASVSSTSAASSGSGSVTVTRSNTVSGTVTSSGASTSGTAPASSSSSRSSGSSTSAASASASATGNGNGAIGSGANKVVAFALAVVVGTTIAF